ncbi:MAG: xanthine dehydrogenase family protein subunit M [Alphaproteobacteria bacterium]|nr:xanthine dehydrogenase family protein subunit M [Alphaproteobacteria bacterium]
MHAFNYHRPTSIEDATKALAAAADGKYLAGGMTLIPTLKQRLARQSDLIDLAAIQQLRGIRDDKTGVSIGAMTTHAELAASPALRAKLGGLARLAECIGDPQVRNRGTIGGALANNDPAADYPAACLALGATIVTDRREIAADGFFKGLFETALDAGELITGVRFPLARKSAYAKFRNPASGYAIVGVFVAQCSGESRVAVTGARQSGVFRIEEMERALTKSWSPDAVAKLSVTAEGLNADIHASAVYRAQLITVMARRAVAAA